jgi:tRNA-uridine 2-sulfurtransferase
MAKKTVKKKVRPAKTKSFGRVFVGMSGGVDSSVAAYLLKKQGYDVVGVFLRCYNIDGCAERDAEDARRVAEKLNIPFYAWDFEEEYKKKVVDYMVEGYREGITPNPDVMCNREIKFGMFLRRALELGADHVATGHYVRLAKKGKELFLRTAKDPKKDQSYFLWTLTQEDLKHCLFPIGEYLKPEVRTIARKAKLSTAEKKDSQGICFLGDVSIYEFLKTYLPVRKGEIVTTTGEKIGEHEGMHFYTIGQRHGLDLKNKQKLLKIKGEHATPAHYVTAKDPGANRLVVAEGESNPALFRKDLQIVQLNLPAKKHSDILSVQARVRYRQPVSEARLEKLENGSWKLAFKKPQKFVAPGQSAVFYDRNGLLLGGGVIV